MKLPAALRLALVPIGVAIAAKGLQYLTDESERLDAEIAARRAELAANAIRDTCPDCWNGYPACEHRPDTSITYAYACTYGCNDGEPAPEDFPSTAALEDALTEESPVGHRTRPRIRVGAVVANAAAFGIGAYLSLRANRWLQDRAAAELAAPIVDDLPEPAPARMRFARLVDLEALREHERARLAAEQAEPAPTAEQVWDTYAEPAAFNHDGPCDPDDCPACRRIRKQ